MRQPVEVGMALCSEPSFRWATAGMKRKRPPPKRTPFERMSDVGDIVGWVDELRY